MQADREALQLRRKLLTRLLQEAKTAWLQLRPREEAIRRALSGQAALPAAAEQTPAQDRDEEAPGGAVEASQPIHIAGEARFAGPRSASDRQCAVPGRLDGSHDA